MKVTFRNAFHFSAITAFHAAPAQRFQTRRVGDDGSGWVGPPDPPLSREPAQRQLNRKEIKKLLTRGSGGTAVPVHVTVHHRRSVAACNPAVSHQVRRVHERPAWPRLHCKQQESAIEEHNANQDSKISDSLHPLVNMAIIGLVLMFVAAVWMFFDSGPYEAWLDVVVTGLFVIAIAIPALFWLIWRWKPGG